MNSDGRTHRTQSATPANASLQPPITALLSRQRRLRMKSELKQRTLQQLANAYSRDELRVNEEYQRGAYKWTRAQNQALIDSLLRGYQIPLFYVHLIQKINAFTGS